MIFAKIDFINLLPFYVFIKKNIRSSQIKQIINYKKSYPSKINQLYKKRKIDAAIISSIASRNCKCLEMGIVAKNEVDSVLVIKNKPSKNDYQSDTSNALAKILEVKGEVIIGDKALEFFYNNSHEEFEDLAKLWKEKYKLPFVFARLCTNAHYSYLQKLSQRFIKSKVKIPQYILKRYAKRSGLSDKQIHSYLQKITYSINTKEKKSLKLFLKLSKKKGV
jgi:chorismate dehydratase